MTAINIHGRRNVDLSDYLITVGDIKSLVICNRFSSTAKCNAVGCDQAINPNIYEEIDLGYLEAIHNL
jgi:hypothetical protein